MALKPSMSVKALLPPGGSPAVRRQYKVRALAVSLVAVLLMWARYQQTISLSGAAKGRLQSRSGGHGTATGQANTASSLQPVENAFTMQFEVCNGFTNQRIALLSGLVLAAAAKRSVVLPEFLLNGMQPDDMKTVTADKAETVPFREWFDEEAFAQAMAAHGVQVVAGVAPNATVVSIKDFDSQSKVGALVAHLKKQRGLQHIRIACPAFRLPGALVKKHGALLHAAVEGLRPSDRFQSIIAAWRQQIEAKSGSIAYNLIHLRVEKDWFALCKMWENPSEGRNNCMNNTATVGKQLQKHGFEPQVPVVVVTSFPDAVPNALDTSLKSIKSSKYNVVLGSELVQLGEELSREENALVDYYLGLEAEKFTGNSVSTFTAFLILERRWLDRQSAHYNGGNIPLNSFFPFF